jgi:hypothetical protein
MEFDYSEYKTATLQFPMSIVIVCSLLIIIMIILFYVIGYKKDDRTTLQVIVAFAIPLVLMIPSILYLSYGLGLMGENESDVVVYSGEITEIKSPIKSPRYYYEDKPVTADIVVVDNIEFYFMTSGSLEIGDEITMEYLPQSMFVLKVEKIE